MSKTIEIYIVSHSIESYRHFISLNRNKHLLDRVKHIIVGDNQFETLEKSVIIARELPLNIEHHKSLLTYTAWWALFKNDLVESDYVGIFEYDVELSDNLFDLSVELDEMTLIGFNPRATNENLYLPVVPLFVDLLSEMEIQKAIENQLWSATSNLIMPKNFLSLFCQWFDTFIPQIFEAANHPHFHERAINVLAANIGVKYEFLPELCKHKQLNSHQINL